MKKQVKLLTLLAVASVGIDVTATPGFAVVSEKVTKPLHCIYELATKKQQTAMLLGAAVVAGLVVSGMEDREFDSNGSHRTVGHTDADPMMAEVAYCTSLGMGATVLSQMTKDHDITLKDGIEKSVINAAALFTANRVAETEVYKSISRNHPLLKGWFSKSITDGSKKFLTAAAAKEVITFIKDKAMAKTTGN